MQKIIEKYDEDTYILWKIAQCSVTFFIHEVSSTNNEGVDFFIKSAHDLYSLDRSNEITDIYDAHYTISGTAWSTGEITIHVDELQLCLDSFEWFANLMNHVKIKIIEYLPEILNQRLLEMKIMSVTEEDRKQHL